MSVRKARQVLIGIALGTMLALLAATGALYLAQRSLIYPAPQHFAAIPAGYQQIALHTADGLDLAAIYSPPRAGQRVVVFFHGNGDSWDGAAQANRLIAGAGFGVLLVEYRGYGGNPGQPDEAGFYADGRAALGWLAAQGLGMERIVLVGNSIGSGTATELAKSTHPAGLVLISAFTSLPAVVGEQLPWLPIRWLVHDKYDNQRKLGAVTAPTLLLHGSADTMIGPSHAEALQAAQPKAQLVLVPEYGHELAYQEVSQRIELAWLQGL